ncbi:MAG: ABC transporter permease [Bacillota bacterium]|nr:ABC transporter permease [Bacillota bacterium]
MSFLKQVRFEIRNILKSKFLLIIGILIIVAGAVIPVISLLSQRNNNGGGVPEPTFIIYDDVKYASSPAIIREPNYPGRDDQNSITIDGTTIYADNPFFWNLQSLVSEKESLDNGKNPFKTPAALDLTLQLIDAEISYYLVFARHITTYQDYRMELAWRGVDSLYDKFFYEHNDLTLDVLIEVASYRKGFDPQYFKEKYVDITPVEKLAGIDKAEENLEMLTAIVVNSDFPQYIALRIQMLNDEIVALEENIAIQVQAIIDNPTQEEYLNQIIEQLRRQIETIKTNSIPILEYRLEKNIIPGLNIWQNNAISDIENARNQLSYTVIMTEEEWNNSRGGGGVFSPDSYYKEQGEQTYAEYVASMQKQIDTLNKQIIIAQKSLDADKPDMIYVPNGARTRTIEFLEYATIVALFGVLLGGWLIASEYQQGTIRLLMIRPKTRSKILLAKFTAALVVWLVVDLAGSFLNFTTNGICFGFADYAYPNYSVAGEIGFIAYYIPRLLACILPILFTFTAAFMLSVLVKNIAVSIAIPIVFYVGSVIVMSIFAYRGDMNWIAYTPIPFMQMAAFFSRYSSIQYILQRGVNLSLTYGILLLLLLSAVFTSISVWVFKKRDIVN